MKTREETLGEQRIRKLSALGETMSSMKTIAWFTLSPTLHPTLYLTLSGISMG